MRVTLAQQAPTLGALDDNLGRARELVHEAAARGSDLVVFPELFLTGYDIGRCEQDLAIAADDPRLVELARAGGDTAVAIGFAELSLGLHQYNSIAYLHDGHVQHVHRKLYLPSYGEFEEHKHFVPGNDIRAFTTPHGRVALLNCNDAWQPQLVFITVQDAARVLVVPASSSGATPGRPWDNVEYWRSITQFYGRMFQVFVVFANRVGVEGSLHFWGGSHVIDPWGELVDAAPEGEPAMLDVTLDLDQVRVRRRQVPLVKEARLAVLEREMARLAAEGGDL